MNTKNIKRVSKKRNVVKQKNSATKQLTRDYSKLKSLNR